MNARQATQENENLIANLIESSKEMALRLGITTIEAIEKKVKFYIKYATSNTAKTAWVVRGEEAIKIAS